MTSELKLAKPLPSFGLLILGRGATSLVLARAELEPGDIKPTPRLSLPSQVAQTYSELFYSYVSFEFFNVLAHIIGPVPN